ncbi:putative transposase [Wolbachia endosymbiont of Drosophila ananassae]|nr:putative transposase [Wolbachia endosymbiont of Drosophila ananassae]
MLHIILERNLQFFGDLQIDVIIGCVLIMRQDLTRVNIAMAKRLCKLFLIANILLFQKNISSITQEPDISFDYLNSSVS